MPLLTDKCTSFCGNIANSTVNATMESLTFPVTSTALPFNSTEPLTSAMPYNGDDTPFYNISYHYISAIGLCTTLAVGIIVSLITCEFNNVKLIH